MTLLGTGTSHGIPVIGCSCRVCTGKDPRDCRYRCSAFIEPQNFLIDTGPEFRLQAIRAGIKKVSAVFITHSHADHLNGLDDLRIFSHTRAVDPSRPNNRETEGTGLPVYANPATIRDIKRRFDYAFTPLKEGGGKPKFSLIDSSVFSPANPLELGGIKILPVPLRHGSLTVTGWLFTEEKDGIKKSIAYLTDCSRIEQSSFSLIKENAGQLCHLVIDGLRAEVHSTHFSFEQAMEAADILNARHTWITHITHNKSHEEIKDFLSARIKNYKNLSAACAEGGSVEPAYDGLILES